MTFNHLKNNLILPASVALVFMHPELKAQDKKETGEKTEKRGPNIVYVFPDQYRKQAMGFWGKNRSRVPSTQNPTRFTHPT